MRSTFRLVRRNSQDTLISLFSILRLFIYLSFFVLESCGGRYHHRYWRSTRESSDSFRRVRNNLLNYRMPKVTSTRREAGEGGGGEVVRGSGKGMREGLQEGDGGCNGTDRRNGRFATIGIFHGISRTRTYPRVCTLILTKLANKSARKNARANSV